MQEILTPFVKCYDPFDSIAAKKFLELFSAIGDTGATMKQEHENEDRSEIVDVFGKTNPPEHEKRLHYYFAAQDNLLKSHEVAPGIA